MNHPVESHGLVGDRYHQAGPKSRLFIYCFIEFSLFVLYIERLRILGDGEFSTGHFSEGESVWNQAEMDAASGPLS